MDIDRKNMKRIVIYLNSTQKENLQKFLHSIGFYYYTVQSKLEGSWEHGIRHLNTTVWPGTESVFYLIVSSDKTELMLSKLKYFRSSLPNSMTMAVLVCSLDDFIYNMGTVNIEPNSDTENVNWLISDIEKN